MRFSLFIFVFLFLLPTPQQAQNWDRYAVFFGENESKMPAGDEQTIRVFLDEQGNYYPRKFKVKDRHMAKSGSNLNDWYKVNNALALEVYNSNNLSGVFNLEMLNKTVAKAIAQEINVRALQYQQVCFLIHGFRKRAYCKKDNALSYTAFKGFKNEVKRYSNKSILFVEIYWDSKYIKALKAGKVTGFEILEQAAIPNAMQVGNSLNLLLSHIQKDSIKIISHSLGAAVVCDMLFKTDSLERTTTPRQFISAYLIAPAIGLERFYNYMSRSIMPKQDNYQFYILYNQNDFVLNKTFYWKGILDINYTPTQYGNTSLGCNYNGEIDRLKHLFLTKYPNQNMPICVDLSLDNAGKPMRCHHFNCYYGHAVFLRLVKGWFGKKNGDI